MNDAIFFFFYNLAHQSHFFDQVVIFFAVYFPYMVILSAGIFLLFHHDILFSQNPFKSFMQKWREILLVFFSGISAWFLAYILKFLLQIERPFEIFSNIIPLFPKTGYAFPSGHATFFMALAMALFFSHKRIGYLFMLFAILIGIARIVSGVHSPIDILGGFALGFLIAFLLRKV
jgi:undecaprenyl-diphosphatase